MASLALDLEKYKEKQNVEDHYSRLSLSRNMFSPPFREIGFQLWPHIERLNIKGLYPQTNSPESLLRRGSCVERFWNYLKRLWEQTWNLSNLLHQ